jgi:putative Holliday junction resolvase
MTKHASNKYLNKTILAVDYGFKVIGTAIFRVGNDPYPLMHEKILFKDIDSSIANLKQIVENESIDIVIFGLPHYTDGKRSDHTLKTENVGIALKALLPQSEFYFQDETLTTKEAEDRMKNSPEYNFKVDPTKIDCLSAVIILEDFLRSN